MRQHDEKRKNSGHSKLTIGACNLDFLFYSRLYSGQS
jgi:hypothetical protein